MQIRDIMPQDLDALLAINQANLPAVSPLSLEGLKALVHSAAMTKVIVSDDGRPVGFLLCLGPKVAYDSENYRWFSARYPRFLYIDRIVLAQEAQRKGLGARLYREAQGVARTMGVDLLCEVNIKPSNDVSLAFHEALGFESVGRQDTCGGEKTVTMLRWHGAVMT